MAILSRRALLAALDAEDLSERLIVTPLLDRDEQIDGASIDLRLDSSFIIFERANVGGVDPLDERAADLTVRTRVSVPFGEGLWLHPHEMVLGASLEFVRLPPRYVARVTPRSTWGRLGLTVATADLVHPNLNGGLTLELVNQSSAPLKLYPGFRVAQLSVENVAGALDRDDGGRLSQYAGATRAEAPRAAWTQDELARIRSLNQPIGAV